MTTSLPITAIGLFIFLSAQTFAFKSQGQLATEFLGHAQFQSSPQRDCPADMVDQGDFCIDRYEAPNLPGAEVFVARTALEGEKWCKSQGKELCSDVQWIKACQGRPKNRFPYGQKYRPHACNQTKSWKVPNWRLVAKYNPKNPDAHPAARDHINHLNQSESAGYREECRTEAGVFDLTGNVAEWVRNTRGIRSRASNKVWKHNIKGCYWVGCFRGSKPDCHFTNPSHASAFRSYETGFRCCLKKSDR